MKDKASIFYRYFKGLSLWGGPLLLVWGLVSCGGNSTPEPEIPKIQAGWMLEQRHLEQWRTEKDKWLVGDQYLNCIVLRPPLNTALPPAELSAQPSDSAIVFLPLSLADIFQADSLAAARRIMAYAAHEAQLKRFKIKELVVWYAWTNITKDAYFRLLRCLDRINTVPVTAMLQAGNFRYPLTYGIPPVERVWLQGSSFLALINKQEDGDDDPGGSTAKYWNSIGAYPLPIDLYLPWTPLLLECTGQQCTEYPYLDAALLQDTFLFKSSDGISFSSTNPDDSLRSFQAMNNHWRQAANLASMVKQSGRKEIPRICFAQWEPGMVSMQQKPSLQAVVNYFRK